MESKKFNMQMETIPDLHSYGISIDELIEQWEQEDKLKERKEKIQKIISKKRGLGSVW